jgi:tRNA modification GTPase
MSSSPTVVTTLSPEGRGGIATIVVCGASGIESADRYFRAAAGVSLSQAAANRILFGRFRGMTGGDEEIVAVVTAADEIELHCHGGPAAVEAITGSLAASGAERITWQQYVERSENDRIRREARCALALAATERTCGILLDQYRGALGRELSEIETLLTNQEARGIAEARGRLELLLDRWNRIGQHLTKPWRLVIAGPPNVGKSSLMNALLGYQRSITCDQPGTTRDALSAAVALDGWPVELLDTAGLRAPGDPLEAAGVERARDELAVADGVLAVVDMTVNRQPQEHWARCQARENCAILWVGNKSDLLTGPERNLWQRSWPDARAVSAKTGAGIEALSAAIVQRLTGNPVPAGAAVPFLPRHGQLVRGLYQRSPEIAAPPTGPPSQPAAAGFAPHTRHRTTI